MVMNFPSPPPPLTVGQQFSPDGIVYVWDGVKWTSAGGSGGGGIGGDVVSSSVTIEPGIISGVGAKSRLGLNMYIDQAGAWRYTDDGPAAMMLMQSSAGLSGAGSRFNVVIADINNAGAGALAIPEGIFNIVYGPPGSAANQAYVVLGNANNVPAQPPTFGTLFSNGVTIAPADLPTVGAKSRLGLNLYVDSAGAYRYLADGPAAMIVMQSSSPQGPGSRLNVSIADINSAGPGTPTAVEGILNVMYGPQNSGPGNAYVVIGDASHIPNFQPPGDALLCGELFAGEISVSVMPNPAGANAARLFLNCYADPITNPRFLEAGHAYQIGAFRDAGYIRINWAPPGAAGTPTSPTNIFQIYGFGDTTAVPAGSTNFMCGTNKTGAFGIELVQLGPPDSGGLGYRALRVTN